MDVNDPYAAIAPYYDLEFSDLDADVGLYLGYAGIVGSPILELGCGTGRLLLPLAEAGYEVTGIDSSPAMIGIACERLAGYRNVDVRLGEMTCLDDLPHSRYRLVFVALNTFLHLESREDQLAALAAIRRVLHHDGILVIDVFHPLPSTLQSMLDDHLHFDGHWELPGGERLDRFSHRRLHAAEQWIDTTLYYDRISQDGTVRRSIARYGTRYVHRFEMEGLLAESGFVIEGVYGSYQLDPLDNSSSEMIFVAHRRAGD